MFCWCFLKFFSDFCETSYLNISTKNDFTHVKTALVKVVPLCVLSTDINYVTPQCCVKSFELSSYHLLPSVLLHCWLGIRKSNRPVKIE